jgi:hypothetical protein
MLEGNDIWGDMPAITVRIAGHSDWPFLYIYDFEIYVERQLNKATVDGFMP